MVQDIETAGFLYYQNTRIHMKL